LYAGFSRTRAKDVTVSDFLDEKRREITKRLAELKPVVEEFHRLEAAATALASALGSAASEAGAAVVRRRGPGRPRGSSSRKKAAKATATAAAPKPARKPGRPAKRRAGTPKGSGTRTAQALSFVQGQPGITIPELAAKMGIKQNYLYRVLPGLQKEGKIRKDGRGWRAKAA
jgi:ribosomal protein S25